MHGVRQDAETQGRRLLRFLFVRFRAVSAKDGRSDLLLKRSFMKRRYVTIGIVAALLLAFGVVVFVQFRGGQEFSSDMNSLRTQFNADRGRPRLLVLLSPT
jgi:hypothetical protein